MFTSPKLRYPDHIARAIPKKYPATWTFTPSKR